MSRHPLPLLWRERAIRGMEMLVRPIRPFLPEHSRFLQRWRAIRRHWLQPEDPIEGMVQAFAAVRPDVFFVQVGANDGEQRDPLRASILKHRWRGIMVEPVPYVFARLRANYGAQAGVVLENVAIADRDGVLPFYYLRRVEDFALEGLPRWYDALGSFRRDVVLKHRDFIPDIEQRLVTAELPCITFDSLCRRNRVDHVDLLQIDTEGYDYEIIKMVDFARWHVLLVIYEHHHLSPADQRACAARLEEQGYESFAFVLDTVALRTRELPDHYAPLLRAFRRYARQAVTAA